VCECECERVCSRWCVINFDQRRLVTCLFGEVCIPNDFVFLNESIECVCEAKLVFCFVCASSESHSSAELSQT
jgi:hypothetical protein